MPHYRIPPTTKTTTNSDNHNNNERAGASGGERGGGTGGGDSSIMMSGSAAEATSGMGMEPLLVDSSAVVKVDADDDTEQQEHAVVVAAHSEQQHTAAQHNVVTAAPPPPSATRVHAALILGQSFFGLGSVIAALGLPACNPFAFALYREVTAGVLLLLAATAAPMIPWRRRRTTHTHPYHDRHHPLVPLWEHPMRFLWLGLAIFANQAGGIVGIKLAGPIAAAVWQPSQPIMTAAICMALRYEPFLGLRVVGVAIAFGACVLMVLLSPSKEQDGHDDNNNNNNFASYVVGNLLFFVNCLGTSLYVILSKKVLRLYPPLTVTALSYNVAAVFMAVAACLFSTWPPLMQFVCPECTSTWGIPSGAEFALAYFILFNSCAAYAIMTWANQHATGTLVMGFTVLQPVTADLFTVTLLGMNIYSTCAADGGATTPCLDFPTWSSGLGMIGVFAGLFLVIATEPERQQVHRHQALAEDVDNINDDDEDDDGGLLETEAVS